MTILAVVFISLFIRLGFWQIQRCAEKTRMLAAQADLAKQQPISWESSQTPPIQYQRIKLQGNYLDSIFFLDNQHHQHQFGYNVLSPLLLTDGSVVMVDRGWIQGDNMRDSFPEIQFPEGLVTVQGSAYFPNNKQWILGPSMEEKNNKIIIIELLDTKMISHLLQKKVYPFIIRLNEQDAYGFVREWAIVSMPPQRHLAYALQWFVMALIILILFVALNLKKKNEKTNN